MAEGALKLVDPDERVVKFYFINNGVDQTQLQLDALILNGRFRLSKKKLGMNKHKEVASYDFENVRSPFESF